MGNVGVNAEEVTGGISEALISTAAGLIIAIFTLIFSNYFKAIRNKQLRIMNEFCGKFETLYSSKNFKKYKKDKTDSKNFSKAMKITQLLAVTNFQRHL